MLSNLNKILPRTELCQIADKAGTDGFAQDLTLWYPKVRSGGIISGHDYIWGGKGVKPVVDKFANKPINHIKKQGVWWYEK